MTFRDDVRTVGDALADWVETSHAVGRPAIRQRTIAQIIRDDDVATLMREGGLNGPALRRFVNAYLDDATALHHPACMAHQVAVPSLTGALAGLMDGVTNNAMSVYEMGPSSSAIEYYVINWMLEKVGWTPAPLEPTPDAPTDHGGGVLTHGGSLANLTALIAARNHACPEAWEFGSPHDLALMAPAGAHYSISRAAGILGLGQQGIAKLDVDARGAIIPDRLPVALERLRDVGRRPFALVASACSTAVGIYDRLAEIAEFCRAIGLWLHIDGAHGASALLSHSRRKLLRGVEGADSLVWDAHKCLQTPVLCAAVLVRNARTLDRAFQQDASYLFHDKEQPGVDFGQRSFECTKAGLGLRAFMAIASLGEKALGEFIDRQSDLAMQAYELISRTPGFSCAVRPQSNIVCFRHEGDDALQLRVRAAILAEGRYYLSSAQFAGRRWLRIVLMNPRTTLEHVAGLLEAVRSAVDRLSA